MKPILFNTDMVRATLKDRKTETRRLVKPIPPENARLELVGDRRHAMDLSIEIPGPNDRRIYTPPYLPDDILYVRETWAEWTGGYVYKADGTCPGYPLAFVDHWHPSIHMPKEAARIFLHVTDLRVERLQNITEEGAQSEGIRGYNVGMGEVAYSVAQSYQEAGSRFYDHPIGAFADLWNSTLKHMDHIRYGWAADPWVWVIKYERCEKPEEG